MMNFARFIPGTPDADFMRQQVSERGILEKIDAVNETIERCLGEGHPVSEISDFYKMINDIEHSLNQNMNDPRAKNLVNTFTEAPKVETKKETPKPETPKTPDTTAPNEDAGVGTGTGTADPAENTGVTDSADGDDTDNPTNEGVQETAGNGDNPESEGIQEPSADNGESTGSDTTEPEDEQPTRRGRKKSEDAE
jgi:hypothetical protein